MDLKRKYLIVWITDGAARLFLGLTGRRPESRWAVWGKYEGEDHGVLWITIDEIEERRPSQGRTVRHVRWKVKPQTCSINQNWIITVQVAGEFAPDSKEIGFTHQTVKG